MKNKRITAVIFLIILLVAVIILPLGNSRRKNSFTVKDGWLSNTVENGQVLLDSETEVFTVEKEGRYRIRYGWRNGSVQWNELSNTPDSERQILTVMRITDSHGRQVFSACGTAVYADTFQELPAGRYSVEFRFFTKRDSFIEYAREYLCSAQEAERLADEMDFELYERDGLVMMVGLLSLYAENIDPLFIVKILIIAALLATIIYLLTKDKWKKRDSYDERQQLERGRAFRLGFITTVVGIILAIFVDLMNILPSPIHSHVLYGAALYAGSMVFAMYCIWHEAYFSLKEKPRSTVLLLGGIGAFNLLIALGTMLSKGSLMKNGRLTYPAMNAVSALVMLVLLLFVGLKASQLRKLAAAEAEDEEDEDGGGQGRIG